MAEGAALHQKPEHHHHRSQLNELSDIVATFIDSFNHMLAKLAMEPQFIGRVHYMFLRGMLPSHANWANELHSKQDGFRKLAAKIDLELHPELSHL